MLNYTEFVEYYYEHGKCINDVQPRSRARPLNEKELVRRHGKYIIQESKRTQFSGVQNHIDLKEKSLFEEVSKRDNHTCRFLSIYKEPVPDDSIDWKIIDHAHVLSKAQYPLLKYEISNVVCLNRFSHRNIDQHKHPFMNERISKEETGKWWLTILGNEQYTELRKVAHRKGYTGI